MRHARILPLGPACFSLLSIFVLLRVAAAFLPCDRFGESGSSCAESYLLVPSNRSHTCVANAAIADAARVSNRIDFLNFRRERFTIDERGYRNPPGMSAATIKALLVGDSFSLGVSLSDDEIFSARLNQRLGPVVYNTGFVFNASVRAEPMIETAREVGMNGGWILFEFMNREPLQFGPPSSGDTLRHSLRQGLRNSHNPLVPILAPAITLGLQVFAHPTALIRASTLLNVHIEDDRLLPNPFKDQYSEEQLVDGRHVLVYCADKGFAQNPSGLSGTADALVRLRDELARHGYRLAVVMVPNSYSVYYPFYLNRPQDDASATYMAALTARLAENRVPVRNLLPPMRQAARRELASGRMIYFPDDAHWNSLGCDIAAAATAPWLRSLLEGRDPAKDDTLP